MLKYVQVLGSGTKERFTLLLSISKTERGVFAPKQRLLRQSAFNGDAHTQIKRPWLALRVRRVTRHSSSFYRRRKRVRLSISKVNGKLIYIAVADVAIEKSIYYILIVILLSQNILEPVNLYGFVIHPNAIFLFYLHVYTE